MQKQFSNFLACHHFLTKKEVNRRESQKNIRELYLNNTSGYKTISKVHLTWPLNWVNFIMHKWCFKRGRWKSKHQQNLLRKILGKANFFHFCVFKLLSIFIHTLCSYNYRMYGNLCFRHFILHLTYFYKIFMIIILNNSI